jgi:hypothetical protein
MKNTWILISAMLLASGIMAGFTTATSEQTSSNPRSSQSRQRPAETRVPGMLNRDTDATIVAPSTIGVNQPFQVTITTTGGGCEREGDASVILSENSASVMVYDFTTATRPGIACTMILKRFSHTVTLSFSKAGEAVINVWGRQTGPTTSPFGAPVVMEKRILVK